MLKFSEIFEFSRENSYFERIRMVRMVRMVRSLADRTFQLRPAGRRVSVLQRRRSPPGRRRFRAGRRSAAADGAVGRVVPHLVERFDTEPFSDFSVK